MAFQFSFNNPRKLFERQFLSILLILSFSISNTQDDPRMANAERTFIMCKPDAVQRGIVGEIIKRFEAKGFKLVAMKMMWVSELLKNLNLNVSPNCGWRRVWSLSEVKVIQSTFLIFWN